jgi:NADH-quinone oxidoreductase subunit H
VLLLAPWYDFRDLSHAVRRLLDAIADVGGPDWLIYVLSAVIGCAGLGALIGGTAVFNIWLERRVVGRLQIRRGPNRAGPWGLLQPIADTLKLVQKESLTPRAGDFIVFTLAPVLVFVPAILAFAVLPWGPGMTFTNLNVGLLYIVAITSVTVLAVFMAGWSSNNKYSLLGAIRGIAMLISYEIPAVLTLLGVVIFAGTMSISGIVLWQEDMRIWLVLLQPLPLLIYLITAAAEINRTPTDIPEAESELVAGYHTEYSGIKFGMFYAVELVNGVVVSALIASLYFGGWWLFGLNRWIPGWIIFIGKVYAFYFVLIWLRGTLPRFRIDQLMGFAWKFLLPLALVNIFLVALEVLIWVEYEVSAAVVLPIFSAVNIALAGLLVVAWTRLMAFHFERLPKRPRMHADIAVPAEQPAGAAS